MTSIALGGIVFLCLSGSVVIGMWLQSRLPDNHLSCDAKDSIKLATAIIGTLSALALGLLVASSKTAYDRAEAELSSSAANLILLDKVMASYGPETGEARRLLPKLVASRLGQRQNPDDDLADEPPGYHLDIERVQQLLRQLSPQGSAQNWLQARALQISVKIAEDHLLLVDAASESLPWKFVAILVFWLALLFATFGLLAPRNVTVVLVLLLCALSAAMAIFLIADMDHPYSGLIQIADHPLREALEQLGRS